MVFTDEKNLATMLSTLDDVKEMIETRDTENRMDIDNGIFVITSIIEIEIKESAIIDIEDL